VIFAPRASALDPVDVENALLRAALGDYSDEAAVLLLINSGHWLTQLQDVGLITLDGNVDGRGVWAHINWPALDAALRTGTITGSDTQRRIPEAAASIADGHSVDLGDLAAGLDRRARSLVLAVIVHAAGGHDQREVAYGSDGVAHLAGPRLPPVLNEPTLHTTVRGVARRSSPVGRG
jgi:hypothetical protein